MELNQTDEFHVDAVRIALTSGLTLKQVASDLGVGLSTLNKWAKSHEVRVHPLPSSRNEFSTRGKEHSNTFCSQRMCNVLGVSSRGLRIYRRRPASQRQGIDMVLLAYIKE